MSFYSIADFIKEYYPTYWGIQRYPIAECVRVHKVEEEWGILCNFASTPLVVNGMTFGSSEELFQLMKFTDTAIIDRIRQGITNNGKRCYQIKKTVKSYEKEYRRPDWGLMIVDAMKFALTEKYKQCETFREKLEASKGKYIVEDQSTMPKKEADAWGVKMCDGYYIGPNLLGRLLMELRDEGKLDYALPENTFIYHDSLNRK